MKIKPEIYADILISALAEENANSSKIAKAFWYTLQKNGQNKDLKRVFNYIDEKYASNENKTLAMVYSAAPLSDQEKDNIAQKLKNINHKEVIIRNIIKKNSVAGVIVKIGDKEVDLSLGSKVTQLTRLLVSSNSENI